MRWYFIVRRHFYFTSFGEQIIRVQYTHETFRLITFESWSSSSSSSCVWFCSVDRYLLIRNWPNAWDFGRVFESTETFYGQMIWNNSRMEEKVEQSLKNNATLRIDFFGMMLRVGSWDLLKNIFYSKRCAHKILFNS